MIGSQRTEGQRGADKRRNIELAMLGFALAVCFFAYISADEAMNDKLPPGLLVYGVSFTALTVGAHLVIRRWARYADPLILPCATLLTGLGVVLLNRLDESYKIVGTFNYEKAPVAPSQVMWVFLAVPASLSVLVFVKHHRFFQRYIYILMIGALILLAAPAFFPGDDFGAKRWIHLPGIQVEPDEFVKLAICVFFAGYLMVSRDALALVGRKVWGLSLPRGRNAAPVLAIWMISLLVLIFERDLGTSLIFFGVFIVMLYVATERTSWVVIGLIMAVGGAAVVGTLEPHVHGRVTAWLNPLDYYKTNPPGSGAVTSNQQAEALFSFGSGHIVGTGLGQGYPWLVGFAGRSDFIFTTVGEELGLAGVIAVLMVYGLFVQRGLKTAIGLSDPFGKLLATGLASAVALQVFVVVGGVSGLLPLTGKALPFLAAGGSSTLANWLLTALMIKLSDAAGRTELEPDPEPTGTIAPPKPSVPAQGEDGAALPGQAGGATPPPYGAATVHGTASKSGPAGAEDPAAGAAVPGSAATTVLGKARPGSQGGVPGATPAEQPGAGHPGGLPGGTGAPGEQQQSNPGYPPAGWAAGYPAGATPAAPGQLPLQQPAQQGYPAQAYPAGAGYPGGQPGYPTDGQTGYPTGGQPGFPTGSQPEYLSGSALNYPPHPEQNGTPPAGF
ncbi:FtsW/RodA/SpoVE family cell cycle protein [Kitasatospora sp. LaBMicrA B282]|uniref:FtsW/RodA/SpoVE family cell cycle protein n=1 Tax=Kitasatospora sp. LaBMicrA B282 TaxID=3420949 RepID=UPI003D0A9308